MAAPNLCKVCRDLEGRFGGRNFASRNIKTNAMTQEKMNVTLAKAEHERAVYTESLSKQGEFFKRNTSSFKGEKKTFHAAEGQLEDPTKMGHTVVAATVSEELKRLMDRALAPYLKDQFSIEATNSAGSARVPFIVDGINMGSLSATELLRLKNILTDENLKNLVANIPVRSDSEIWKASVNEDYEGRADIFETPLLEGDSFTTITDTEILLDPNIDKEHLPSGYRPITKEVKTTIKRGSYTSQKFSGEWTLRQKQLVQERISKLLSAVIEATKTVNDTPTMEPNLATDKFLGYIFYGNE